MKLRRRGASKKMSSNSNRVITFTLTNTLGKSINLLIPNPNSELNIIIAILLQVMASALNNPQKL